MGDKADKMGGLCTRNAFLRRVRGALLQGVVSMRIGTRIAVGSLSLTAAGLISIATWEGFKGEAYIPVPGDVPTIGFGSTEGVKLGQTVTVPEALKLLQRDVVRAERAVKSCVRVKLTQGYYDVLVSFAYNIGETAFCSSTLVKRLNKLDYEGACREILRWDKVRVTTDSGEISYVTVKGLTNRRKNESNACLDSIN